MSTALVVNLHAHAWPCGAHTPASNLCHAFTHPAHNCRPPLPSCPHAAHPCVPRTADMRNASALSTLDVRSNRLKGALPEGLPPALRVLSAAGNELDGTLPAGWVR